MKGEMAIGRQLLCLNQGASEEPLPMAVPRSWENQDSESRSFRKKGGGKNRAENGS